MGPGAAKRRERKLLLRTVAEFSKKRAVIQRDAGRIRQHSPLNAPQHLGAAAEASTSTSTIDPSTSKERQMQIELDVETVLQELHRQYRTAQGEELIAIQDLAEDVIDNAFATGELSAIEVGAALMRFSIYPAVADKGSPTGIVDDNDCNLVADKGSPTGIVDDNGCNLVADKGSPTGIVDDTGCNLVANAGPPEDKINDHDPDFFNAFEDDFDDKDLD